MIAEVQTLSEWSEMLNLLPDITRNRHRDNPESIDANIKVTSIKERDRNRILAFADFMGNIGITLKEVVKELDIPIQSASARLSELKAETELIKKPSGERREGCAILIRPKNGQLELL